MKGQSLIASAKTKALIQELDDYATAFITYEDKYGAMPGDDINARNRLQGRTVTGTRVTNAMVVEQLMVQRVIS